MQGDSTPPHDFKMLVNAVVSAVFDKVCGTQEA